MQEFEAKVPGIISVAGLWSDTYLAGFSYEQANLLPNSQNQAGEVNQYKFGGRQNHAHIKTNTFSKLVQNLLCAYISSSSN